MTPVVHPLDRTDSPTSSSVSQRDKHNETPAFHSIAMDRFTALTNICVIAATIIDDGVKFNNQTEATQAAYLERGTILDEIEQQYVAENNGNPQAGINSVLPLLGIRSCVLEKRSP